MTLFVLGLSLGACIGTVTVGLCFSMHLQAPPQDEDPSSTR